jgi:hypothetical protein
VNSERPDDGARYFFLRPISSVAQSERTEGSGFEPMSTQHLTAAIQSTHPNAHQDANYWWHLDADGLELTFNVGAGAEFNEFAVMDYSRDEKRAESLVAKLAIALRCQVVADAR